MKKTYLGDSVYVCIERDMIKLTTENGFGPTNTIFLEFNVFEHLLDYMENVTGKRIVVTDRKENP